MTVHVVQGDDPSLVSATVGDLLDRLIGDAERSLMLEDIGGEEATVAAAVEAARTPPMFTPRRVVVLRDVTGFPADQLDDLVSYLAAPEESTDLVLVGAGRLPKALAEACKAARAEVHGTAPPTRATDRAEWYREQIAEAGLRLDPAAVSLVVGWLGEDAGRLRGLLDTLGSAYGQQRRLGVEEVTPFLGEAGGVPPWDLTDAIDRGDTAKALVVLHRMLAAGGRHALEVMAILHSHFAKLANLDGSGAHDETSAAGVLGIKPGFPARKALEQIRRLGGANAARAVELLADADVDLRGAKEWDEELVLELLVARLSKLAPTRR